MKRSVLLLVIFCWACGSDFLEPKESSKIDKAEFSDKGKADSSIDHCAVFGWYDDGVCDTFCKKEDVEDCRETTLCENLCANRADNSCYNDSSDEWCVSDCEDNSDADVDDLKTCLGQPLCYQTLELCVKNRADYRFCDESCGHRGEGNGCAGERECLDYCWSNIGIWGASEADRFVTCAAENPLCYQTMGQCVGRE